MFLVILPNHQVYIYHNDKPWTVEWHTINKMGAWEYHPYFARVFFAMGMVPPPHSDKIQQTAPSDT